MGELLDLASFDEQPMEVAPLFDPEGELQEIVKTEASSQWNFSAIYGM